MDGGENNGNPNPMNKWDDLGGVFPIFLVGNIQILGFSNLGKIFSTSTKPPSTDDVWKSVFGGCMYMLFDSYATKILELYSIPTLPRSMPIYLKDLGYTSNREYTCFASTSSGRILCVPSCFSFGSVHHCLTPMCHPYTSCGHRGKIEYTQCSRRRMWCESPSRKYTS